MGENPLKTEKTKYIKQDGVKTERRNAGCRGKNEKSKTVLQKEGAIGQRIKKQPSEGLQTAHAG
jgi:hypothetical protein